MSRLILYLSESDTYNSSGSASSQLDRDYRVLYQWFRICNVSFVGSSFDGDFLSYPLMQLRAILSCKNIVSLQGYIPDLMAGISHSKQARIVAFAADIERHFLPTTILVSSLGYPGYPKQLARYPHAKRTCARSRPRRFRVAGAL